MLGRFSRKAGDCHNCEPSSGAALLNDLRAASISGGDALRRRRAAIRHVQHGFDARAEAVVGGRRFGTARPGAILEPAYVGHVPAALDAMNGVHLDAPIWLVGRRTARSCTGSGPVARAALLRATARAVPLRKRYPAPR